MKKLRMISKLMYGLERISGWRPEPPAVKAESARDSTKDGGRKLKWWQSMLLFSVFHLFSPLVSPFFAFYVRLVVGILAIVFFGTIGACNIVHTYQKKENIYYFRTVLCLLMCFAAISIILGHFLLFLIFSGSLIFLSLILHYGSQSDKRGDHPSSGVAGK